MVKLHPIEIKVETFPLPAAERWGHKKTPRTYCVGAYIEGRLYGRVSGFKTPVEATRAALDLEQMLASVGCCATPVLHAGYGSQDVRTPSVSANAAIDAREGSCVTARRDGSEFGG